MNTLQGNLVRSSNTSIALSVWLGASICSASAHPTHKPTNEQQLVLVGFGRMELEEWLQITERATKLLQRPHTQQLLRWKITKRKSANKHCLPLLLLLLLLSLGALLLHLPALPTSSLLLTITTGVVVVIVAAVIALVIISSLAVSLAVIAALCHYSNSKCQ